MTKENARKFLRKSMRKMKQPKCPNCGSANVILTTELEDVQFLIDENGHVDFEASDIRDELERYLK